MTEQHDTEQHDTEQAEQLTRPRYRVHMATDDGGISQHTVTVTVQDRLRAEQVAARMGLPGIKEAQQTHVALWCWAALRREQVTGHSAEHFLNQLLVEFDPAGEAPVDPTRPGAGTGSPSS